MARDTWPASPTGSTAVAALRVLFGLVFAANGVAKLLPGSWVTPFGYLIGGDGALATLRASLVAHPVGPYRELMAGLFIESWPLAALGVGLFEVAIGLLLIIGLGTRWAALLGAGFAIHLHWLTLFAGHWLFEFALLWLPLLALAALDAGRHHGLDGWRRSVALRRNDGG
ncbi:MAG TPA: DoxX family membrane protein [Candidatus Limnocylindrales bacterium]|nr:DoxX family membrane protein [Candidatus Limnocylindrales bacterium]